MPNEEKKDEPIKETKVTQKQFDVVQLVKSQEGSTVFGKVSQSPQAILQHITNFFSPSDNSRCLLAYLNAIRASIHAFNKNNPANTLGGFHMELKRFCDEVESEFLAKTDGNFIKMIASLEASISNLDYPNHKEKLLPLEQKLFALKNIHAFPFITKSAENLPERFDRLYSKLDEIKKETTVLPHLEKLRTNLNFLKPVIVNLHKSLVKQKYEGCEERLTEFVFTFLNPQDFDSKQFSSKLETVIRQDLSAYILENHEDEESKVSLAQMFPAQAVFPAEPVKIILSMIPIICDLKPGYAQLLFEALIHSYKTDKIYEIEPFKPNLNRQNWLMKVRLFLASLIASPVMQKYLKSEKMKETILFIFEKGDFELVRMFQMAGVPLLKPEILANAIIKHFDLNEFKLDEEGALTDDSIRSHRGKSKHLLLIEELMDFMKCSFEVWDQLSLQNRQILFAVIADFRLTIDDESPLGDQALGRKNSIVYKFINLGAPLPRKTFAGCKTILDFALTSLPLRQLVVKHKDFNPSWVFPIVSNGDIRLDLRNSLMEEVIILRLPHLQPSTEVKGQGSAEVISWVKQLLPLDNPCMDPKNPYFSKNLITHLIGAFIENIPNKTWMFEAPYFSYAASFYDSYLVGKMLEHYPYSADKVPCFLEFSDKNAKRVIRDALVNPAALGPLLKSNHYQTWFALEEKSTFSIVHYAISWSRIDFFECLQEHKIQLPKNLLENGAEVEGKQNVLPLDYAFSQLEWLSSQSEEVVTMVKIILCLIEQGAAIKENHIKLAEKLKNDYPQILEKLNARVTNSPAITKCSL